MMTHVAAILLTAVLGVAFCSALEAPDPSAHYTSSQIRRMEAQAHTAADYRPLAAYFRARQKEFENRATEEKKEWEQRARIHNGTYEKPPTPADSARNLYRYFTEQAEEMARQAEHYEALAASVKD